MVASSNYSCNMC